MSLPLSYVANQHCSAVAKRQRELLLYRATPSSGNLYLFVHGALILVFDSMINVR